MSAVGWGRRSGLSRETPFPLRPLGGSRNEVLDIEGALALASFSPRREEVQSAAEPVSC